MRTYTKLEKRDNKSSKYVQQKTLIFLLILVEDGLKTKIHWKLSLSLLNYMWSIKKEENRNRIQEDKIKELITPSIHYLDLIDDVLYAANSVGQKVLSITTYSFSLIDSYSIWWARMIEENSCWVASCANIRDWNSFSWLQFLFSNLQYNIIYNGLGFIQKEHSSFKFAAGHVWYLIHTFIIGES